VPDPVDHELFRVIADALPAVLAYVDREQRYRYANRFYAERYGRADIIGRTAVEVIGREGYARIEPAIRRALSGETVSFEAEIERAPGEHLWVTATYVPDLDEHGVVRGISILSEDITERKRVEREIRAAHAKLDAIFAASPTAIMLLDLDGTVRMWNRAAERIFGWSAEEVIGKPLPAVSAERRGEFLAHLARVGRGEVIDGVESLRRRRDGDLPVTIWAAPVQYEGAPVQCLSIVSDATARRRHEAAERFLTEAGRLLGSSLDYEETLERAAKLAVPDYGDWCFVDLLDDSGAFFDRVAIGAHDPQDPALATIRRRFPVSEVEAFGVGEALATGRPHLAPDFDDAALRALSHDDRQLAVVRAVGVRSLAVAPLMVRGKPIGVLSVSSSRRRLDDYDLWVIGELARTAATAIDSARLFGAEHRARVRMGRLHELTAALSRARTVREVAEVACQVGAQAMEAFTGALWLARADGDLELVCSWGTLVDVIDRYRVITREDPLLPANVVMRTGEAIWVETEADCREQAPTAYPSAKADGRVSSFGCVPMLLGGAPAGVMSFSHPLGHRYDDDERAFFLTVAQHCGQALERARLLDEARAATEAAQAASRVKDEFLAMLGHELRNPLAPILTALQVMTREESSGLRERGVIERQVRHLSRLVDDLLDVSRITTGRIVVEKETLDLGRVIASAAEMTRPLVEARGHTLSVDAPPGLLAFGDETRLAQVFGNLLTNAARYTPDRGHLSIAARREKGELVVVVRDDGAGISAELLPRVFELFQQGPQAPHRPQGGLGLGLAIVKSLVELHGGHVSIASPGPGQGSTVTVRLPAAGAEARLAEPAIAPDAPASVAPPSQTAGTRVMIVDDNVDAAELLTMALAMVGYDARMAHDAVSAIALAGEFSPQLAVLDLGLPGMDGVELGGKLRSRDPALRLVAVTGYGQPKDRARTLDAGFQEHLVKPVDLDRLESVIARLLERP
jgi:PAS domain S-box-containing protein